MTLGAGGGIGGVVEIAGASVSAGGAFQNASADFDAMRTTRKIECGRSDGSSHPPTKSTISGAGSEGRSGIR